MQKAILKAAYEGMRTTILTSYLASQPFVNAAYVFAWVHRMVPVGLADHEKVFEEVCEVPRHAVQLVFDRVDALIAGNELEALAYDRLGRDLRAEDDPLLGVILTYYVLSRGFGVEEYHLVEAMRRNIPDGHRVLDRFDFRDVSIPS